MTSELLIGMQLADKSIYPLYTLGERGVKRITLSAAKQEQEKIELRFYYYYSEDEAEEIADILVEKHQIPGGQWTDLVLECSLDKSTGLQIQVTVSDEIISSRMAELPVVTEDENQEKPVGKSRPVIALILAALFLFASVTGSFYTGKSFSSEAPPDLSVTD